MNRKDCIGKFNYLSFTSAMCVRYHQQKWTFFSHKDKNIRILVGVIALVGVVFSLLGVTLTNLTINILSATISVLALALAIALNVSSALKSEVFHRDLFRRWSDLREEIDGQIILLGSHDSETAPENLVRRLQELTEKKNRINSLEDSPDNELLERCYEDENLARTGYRNKEEKEKAKQRLVCEVRTTD